MTGERGEHVVERSQHARGVDVAVHTGDGGFYHWLELPEGLSAGERVVVEGIVKLRNGTPVTEAAPTAVVGAQ